MSLDFAGFKTCICGAIIPMEAPESSTLVDIPRRRSTLVRSATSGLNSAFADKGTNKTFVGAIVGGNERT